jgi:hypothetical protein
MPNLLKVLPVRKTADDAPTEAGAPPTVDVERLSGHLPALVAGEEVIHRHQVVDLGNSTQTGKCAAGSCRNAGNAGVDCRKGWLEQEPRGIRENLALRPDWTERLDDRHQIVESLERIAVGGKPGIRQTTVTNERLIRVRGRAHPGGE